MFINVITFSSVLLTVIVCDVWGFFATCGFVVNLFRVKEILKTPKLILLWLQSASEETAMDHYKLLFYLGNMFGDILE
jgi:hypothetical protein